MSFPIEEQEESEWCWAAVSSSVDHYFDSASKATQCEVASRVLSTNCCIDRPSCNQQKKLQDALAPLGRLSSAEVGPLEFPTLKSELKAKRPVAVRIAWAGGGAHFVVICGFRVKAGVRIVEIADPFYGNSVGETYFGLWEIDFDLFPQFYQIGGTWTGTFFLKR